MDVVVDLFHNTFEKLKDGKVIIRKGAVKVEFGEVAIIPSHMTGDVLLIKANEKISETLFSMSHGTGRKVSRSEAKNKITPEDIGEIKQIIMLPSDLNFSFTENRRPSGLSRLGRLHDIN